jgi:hypothetical protein
MCECLLLSVYIYTHTRETGGRQVTITGIAASGYLAATDEQGGVVELHPDGNGFDMRTLCVYEKKKK